MDQYLILASKSPRRKEMLQDLGFRLKVVNSNIQESFDQNNSTIEEKVISIANKKANAVVSKLRPSLSKEIVLASDTVVCLGNEILGKPKNRKEAFEILEKLSGKKHTVITATVIIDYIVDKDFKIASKTDVYFKQLDEEMINAYLDLNHYMDKAGAYGIQNQGEWLVERIKGDYFNVMGLSVTTVTDYFDKYHNLEISVDRLVNKHKDRIGKFKSDGDYNE